MLHSGLYRASLAQLWVCVYIFSGRHPSLIPNNPLLLPMRLYAHKIEQGTEHWIIRDGVHVQEQFYFDCCDDL